MDLGGPISLATYNNYKYYITFLDKKTRYLNVYLLKNKSEALNAFNEFKAKAENNNNYNNNNKRIREFFINNRGKYINNNFEIILKRAGIIYNIIPLYIKEPNKLIERINYTLFNKVYLLLNILKLLKYL